LEEESALFAAKKRVVELGPWVSALTMGLMFLKMPYLKSAQKTEKQQPEDTFLVEFLSEMSHKRGVYQYYTLCTLHLTRWRKKEWCDVQHVVLAMVFRYLCPNAGT
jgi:hypothetical protein